MLLNNDAEAAPGMLGALQAAAERHPRAGVLAGKLLYPDGRVQWAGQRVALRTGYSGRPRGHGRPDGFAYSVEGRSDRAVGALLAIAVVVLAAGLTGLRDAAVSDELEWTLPGVGLLLAGVGYVVLTVLAWRLRPNPAR